MIAGRYIEQRLGQCGYCMGKDPSRIIQNVGVMRNIDHNLGKKEDFPKCIKQVRISTCKWDPWSDPR